MTRPPFKNKKYTNKLSTSALFQKKIYYVYNIFFCWKSLRFLEKYLFLSVYIGSCSALVTKAMVKTEEGLMSFEWELRSNRDQNLVIRHSIKHNKALCNDQSVTWFFAYTTSYNLRYTDCIR